MSKAMVVADVRHVSRCGDVMCPGLHGIGFDFDFMKRIDPGAIGTDIQRPLHRCVNGQRC